MGESGLKTGFELVTGEVTIRKTYLRIDNACLASIETKFKCTQDGIVKGVMIRVFDVLLSSNPTIINFLSTIRNNFWLVDCVGLIERSKESEGLTSVGDKGEIMNKERTLWG